MRPKTTNILQLNIAVLIWGGTAMFAKGITLPTGNIICLRSFVSAIALLLFMLFMKIPVLVRNKKDYAVMGITGLILCFHWLTYFQALKVSSAAVAIISLYTYPVFTAIIEPFLFGEKLNKSDVGIAILVLGGILIMTPEISLSNSVTQGILLGILSGLLFMTRNLIVRKYIQDYSSSTLMFWQVLVTFVVLLPVLIIFGESNYTSRNIWLLILLGFIFTALPHTLFSASLKNLSAKTVSILSSLHVFYGALLGFLILDETVTLRTVAGGLIILICIIFETMKNVKEKASGN